MKVLISSRELEILRKSVDGLTAQQIANDLKVSEQTISTSQNAILLRTGERNIANALLALAKRGFILTDLN